MFLATYTNAATIFRRIHTTAPREFLKTHNSTPTTFLQIHTSEPIEVLRNHNTAPITFIISLQLLPLHFKSPHYCSFYIKRYPYYCSHYIQTKKKLFRYLLTGGESQEEQMQKNYFPQKKLRGYTSVNQYQNYVFEKLLQKSYFTESDNISQFQR